MKIYFIGDELTECARDMRKHPLHEHLLGSCYVVMIASYIGYHYPEYGIKFVNYGHSTLKGLLDTTKWSTTINFDDSAIISLALGIEDLKLAMVKSKCDNLVNFEYLYDNLLSHYKHKYPNATIFLMEPYALPGDYTARDWASWRDCLKKAHVLLLNLKNKYNTLFVPLQEAFQNATLIYPADFFYIRRI
jgi:hypothetical protein